MYIIEAYNIHRKYGAAEVLRGIDFNLRPGEIVSIMGPSGSGKSTLLYSLAGILLPDSGVVNYKGKNILAFAKKKLVSLRRTDFGFIFQSSELIPELSVRDNIALPLLLNGEKKHVAHEIAEAWIHMVDLDKVAHSLPELLSGGETQRVAIARAMAINPKVIFADEPTGSLDSINSRRIMKLITAMARKYDAAVVIVTHSDEVSAYADRTIHLRDGRVEEDSL